MDFPYYVGPLHPHQLFDFVSLFVGAQLFWWLQRREPRGALSGDEKWVVAAGCILGAAVGAKLIVLLEDPGFTLAHWREPLFWMGGKSIVGALLGGLVGVETAKRATGITRSTGDHFVLPLCVGLAIGRLGCFFSGLEDDTYGTVTALPWGVDFGDGLARHPTQLYEIAFALLFALAVPVLLRRREEGGDAFRLFMVTYFAFRFLEEFLRESAAPYLGLTIYQIGCLLGLGYYLRDAGVRARLFRMIRLRDGAGEGGMVVDA